MEHNLCQILMPRSLKSDEGQGRTLKILQGPILAFFNVPIGWRSCGHVEPLQRMPKLKRKFTPQQKK